MSTAAALSRSKGALVQGRATDRRGVPALLRGGPGGCSSKLASISNSGGGGQTINFFDAPGSIAIYGGSAGTQNYAEILSNAGRTKYRRERQRTVHLHPGRHRRGEGSPPARALSTLRNAVPGFNEAGGCRRHRCVPASLRWAGSSGFGNAGAYIVGRSKTLRASSITLLPEGARWQHIGNNRF